MGSEAELEAGPDSIPRDLLDLLPGPSFEDSQQGGGEARQGPRQVLVFFVGGVTMAEVGTAHGFLDLLLLLILLSNLFSLI